MTSTVLTTANNIVFHEVHIMRILAARSDNLGVNLTETCSNLHK